MLFRSVSFNNSFTTATLNVTAVRACGSSKATTLVITKKPATPVITGNPTPCPTTQNVYSATTGSTYIWTVPSTASIVGSNTGSSSITVKFSSSFIDGNITVKAVSVCGTSAVKSFAVSKCVLALLKSAIVSTISDSLRPDIIVYPNPTNGKFKIALKGIENKLTSNVLVEIENEYGQLVYSKRVENTSRIIDVTMDRKVAAGIYMVHCIINGESVTKKIVIGR